jgi:hypothetical protein
MDMYVIPPPLPKRIAFGASAAYPNGDTSPLQHLHRIELNFLTSHTIAAASPCSVVPQAKASRAREPRCPTLAQPRMIC